ncbi:FAD-dependent oxidoreductase [Blastopirellula sp. JC732]|uniref:FAD-dependent oxidoreductase n=1 Tax=Blastopirellula sediminis TaxID=2894196 RepID=A0A9X1MMB6_9BACT|nr:FAD-dependent oxidoreductase [Blastopirellula sediminis]MCC9607433.1 FAD-dependent oxidoreductase [Blastopirellula sediminis]MCC9629274.1 FAD-dependent oxidoreductase [Blastopirellula sediminis]
MTLNRRSFLRATSGIAGALSFSPWLLAAAQNSDVGADVVIIGGSLGGCAAAIAALRRGKRVVMTEETDWLGGQLTSQIVPPDEHGFIETRGANASYRKFRNDVRDYYRQNYPLTDAAKAKPNLNPGNGSVSRLCHEPRVAVAVFNETLAPYLQSGQLTLLLEHVPVQADMDGDRVGSVTVRSLKSGDEKTLTAPYFIDATELGDLLPLTGTEYITGAEAKSDTHELHAAEVANPANQQAFTVCFPLQYVAGENFVGDKPADYDFWRDYVPALTPPWSGKLLDLSYSSPRDLKPKKLGFDPTGAATAGTLNLWNYRRIVDANNFLPGSVPGSTTLVNWPQNDYVLGNLIDVSEAEKQKHIAQAKQLSLSLFYWLQTECPRADGGAGFPGLRLVPEMAGTTDGMAKYPYVRESRRILAEFTVTELHVGAQQRAEIVGKAEKNMKAAPFADSVGVGSYHIDLHPSSGGNNYIDFASLPFQIPLGSLIPRRVENLIPACKNIGTTHLSNGCYRLHPVEWGIGEAAGCLASYALETKATPRAIRASADKLADFQRGLVAEGVEISWEQS